MNINYYSEHFAKNMHIKKNNKTLGITKRQVIIFVVTALFSSKILLLLSIYKYFLLFNLALSFIIFCILTAKCKTYSFLKYFYYSDRANTLIPISIDILKIHGAQSINALETSAFNIPMHLWYLLQRIISINIIQLFAAFSLVFLLTLFISYAIISGLFFLENMISSLMTSFALEYKI